MQMLALPFKGKDQEEGQIACLVLLPNKTIKIEDLESSLSASDLENWMSNLKQEYVNVKLPKFTFSKRFSSTPLLKNLE